MAENEWRDIPGIYGHQICRNGTVKRIVTGKNGMRPKVLKQYIFKKTKYPYVSIFIDGKRKKLTIHRLLVIVFIGPPPFPGAQVAHWDGSKDNISLDNLSWSTSKENQEDSVRHGTRILGERHPMAKLCVDDIREIRGSYDMGVSQYALADQYGVHQSQIHRICTGKTWKHI